MPPVENAEPSVAERLNRECRCIGTDVPELHQWLEDDLASRGLSQPIVATNPHLFSDLPVFIAAEHARQMQRVIDAVESVVELPAYRELVLSRAPAIAQAAPAARGVLMGYDFHISESGPMLIEINTNAGGALLNVAMRRAQQACCPEVADYLRRRPSADQLEDELFQMFVSEWRLARGNRPLGRVAIVDDDPSTQYLLPEFLLFQQLFETRGVSAVVAAADQLSCDRGVLWHDGERIDIVYNRLTDFYFSAPSHAALAQAYTADLAVITPHPHAHALHSDKRNLVTLTNEGKLRAMGVAGDTIEVLLHHIPRTVCPSGDEERWWADRKQWFFKPAQGFGSRGSYRGDKLTRRVFGEVMRSDYVAQMLIPPSERSRGGEGDRAVFKLDVRNYVYNSKTQLIAARLYQGQTTNFRTSGGGFAPVYLVPTDYQTVDADCRAVQATDLKR
jgi:hypothetical protein